MSVFAVEICILWHMYVLTGDGKVPEQLVRVLGAEPLDEVCLWEFTTDDGGHIEGLVSVKGAG